MLGELVKLLVVNSRRVRQRTRRSERRNWQMQKSLGRWPRMRGETPRAGDDGAAAGGGEVGGAAWG
eukprot:766858-Hanusia_phi.AAC.2